MCDTLVALGSTTKDGVTLFGKNSDREPDEVQNLVIIPHQKHAQGSKVHCTYIEIPQVEETASVLLSQPFWMFGAEMGANEYGVVIGNEATFTKEKPAATGLLGMDLLRLTLERSKSAKEARNVLIDLLEQYGQGGKCGYREDMRYMNSFLIADKTEAYVVETVHKWWAWKQIKDYWSISNIISLERDYDAVSPGLIENAIKKGWCSGENDFNFRVCYSDTIITKGAAGAFRQSCSRKRIAKLQGQLATVDVMQILRDHGDEINYSPKKGISGSTVCMHAANGLIRKSQSVNSLVARLEKDKPFYYSTGASAPCIRPFFPIFFPNHPLPTEYQPGGAEFDTISYWWQAEQYHRKALTVYSSIISPLEEEMGRFESEMVAAIESSTVKPDLSTANNYFATASMIVNIHGKKWLEMSSQRLPLVYKNYWKKYNQRNGLPDINF
jgi:dipeptidase